MDGFWRWLLKMKIFAYAAFLFACHALVFPLQVLVSNASIGGTVYVFVQEEGGGLFEGAGSASSPLGGNFPLEIRKGQASFRATEAGEWEIAVGGVKRTAHVLDEPGRGGVRSGQEGEFTIFFAAIGAVFVLGVCGLAIALGRALGEKGREERAEKAQRRRLERGDNAI